MEFSLIDVITYSRGTAKELKMAIASTKASHICLRLSSSSMIGIHLLPWSSSIIKAFQLDLIWRDSSLTSCVTTLEFLVLFLLVIFFALHIELALLIDHLVTAFVEFFSHTLVVALFSALRVHNVSLFFVRVGQMLREFLLIDLLFGFVANLLNDSLYAKSAIRIVLAEVVLEVGDVGLGTLTL